MRRLTDGNLADIRGRTIQGYRVVAAKIRQGSFVDSDHCGVMLGKNTREEYVTWEFYLKDNESVSVCRGHYMTDREEAIRDYHARGVEGPQKFHVTVTETFQTTIEIEADSKQKAEQIVSTDWRKREFVLGPECLPGWSLRYLLWMDKIAVFKTTVIGTKFAGMKYPLKSTGFEGYSVPKLVSKSMFHISYVIGKEVDDEELYLWLRPRQHRTAES